MVQIPKQPPNSDVVGKDGQFKQELLRYWDSVARTAQSAIQSFSEFFTLETIGTVDTAADYLLIYDASTNSAKKVLGETILPGEITNAATLIESWTVTATTEHTFTDIPQSFKSLVLQMEDCQSSGGSSNILLHVSADNGSTFETGFAFGGMTFVTNSASSVSISALLSDSPQFAVCDVTAGNSGFARVDGYFDTSSTPKILLGASSRGTASRSNTNGILIGVGAINAIKITNAGTFTANGTISLHGIP